jgi:hypothetical protein
MEGCPAGSREGQSEAQRSRRVNSQILTIVSFFQLDTYQAIHDRATNAVVYLFPVMQDVKKTPVFVSEPTCSSPTAYMPQEGMSMSDRVPWIEKTAQMSRGKAFKKQPCNKANPKDKPAQNVTQVDDSSDRGLDHSPSSSSSSSSLSAFFFLALLLPGFAFLLSVVVVAFLALGLVGLASFIFLRSTWSLTLSRSD